VDHGELDTTLIMRPLRNTERVLNNAAAKEVLDIEKKGNVTIDDIKHIVTGKRGLDMLEHGDTEKGILSIGQIIGLVRDVPTVAELIERIMADAEAILHKRFKAMSKEAALAK
jgi:nitronate monooxygenase